MSTEDNDLSRRDFVKESAILAAASAAWYGIAMKTDALGQTGAVPLALRSPDDDIIPYMYGEAGP